MALSLSWCFQAENENLTRAMIVRSKLKAQIKWRDASRLISKNYYDKNHLTIVYVNTTMKIISLLRSTSVSIEKL